MNFNTMPMTQFDHNGVQISFLDLLPEERTQQREVPVLLIHGFASSAHVNWVYPSWVTTLTRAGYRVIALDNRGHGESEKLYDPSAYYAATMAMDAKALLDHLSITQAHVMGYSMGARLTAFLSLQFPERVRSAVFGGLGMGMVTGVGASQPIVDALLADDPDSIPDQVGKRFRAFADATKSDRKALAACMVSTRQTLSEIQIGELQPPALVAVGTKDDISGSGQGLADLIPGAEFLEIPGRDHQLAVGDKVYKAGVLKFWDQM
ncbi:MAG: alpha/beta fold hydrolase [Hyphomicrobiales bacterium]